MFQIKNEIIEKMKAAINNLTLKPFIQTAGPDCRGCSGSCSLSCTGCSGTCAGSCDGALSDRW